MEQFFNAICAPMIWVIAILELALLVFMVIRYVKTKSIFTLVVALITFGLFFDAFIIGLGAFMNAENLRAISQFRFVSHGLLIPLLFVVCSLALGLKKPWKYIIYGLTIALMFAGVAEGFATVLGVQEIAGISRMASIKTETPKWAATISQVLSFGTVFPLIGVGIYCWIKQKTPLLFLAGFLMFFFSAIGPATGNSAYIFFISMIGEILMVTFMLLYIMRQEKKTGETVTRL